MFVSSLLGGCFATTAFASSALLATLH
jgi:hypothetical protein